jgi:hypothetical protein
MDGVDVVQRVEREWGLLSREQKGVFERIAQQT